MVRGAGASKGPQLLALRHAGYTAAHWKSYGDEPRPPKVGGSDTETAGSETPRVPLRR